LPETFNLLFFRAQAVLNVNVGGIAMPIWTEFWVIVPPVVLLISAFAVYFVRDAKEKRKP
jgi:hypothetical protein